MGYMLLLYDTNEKDLARDIKEFLNEIGVEDIKMIPMEADRGLTLQGKEAHYIESAIGAVFLITPGSTRLEKLFPSPSVSVELGQTKQRFKKYPERVLYLVDRKCELPSIEQRCYIPFDRNDIRSIVGSLTLFVRNLKESGLITGKRIKPMETPGIDIPKLAKSLRPRLKEVCMDLSEVANGAMEDNQFDHHLKNKYSMKDQNIT